MDLPLPKLLYDVQPGGRFVTSRSGLNSLNEQELKNTMQELQNKYYAPNIQSEIAQRQASTNRSNQLLPLDVKNQQNINDWYARKAQAEINAQNAMANLRNMGGSGAGTGQKEELFFQSLVGKENPQLKTPEQVYQASNALRQGLNVLPDGTKINALSPASQASFDRLTKGGTYAGAAVPLLKARQADAELQTLMSMSQKDFEPYATTYAGYSPQQIIDTFKDDKASQEKLGNFIASQAAQYEAAQIRNRIAGGESGITATQELMGKSGQIIKTHFPRLSSAARAQATKRLDEYLSAALQSRQSVGLGASSASQFGAPVGGSVPQSGQGNMVKVLTPSGKQISLPREGAQRLIQDHPDHKIIG